MIDTNFYRIASQRFLLNYAKLLFADDHGESVDIIDGGTEIFNGIRHLHIRR